MQLLRRTYFPARIFRQWSMFAFLWRILRGESFTTRGHWAWEIRFVVFVLLTSYAFAQPWEPEVIWEREGRQDSSRYGAAILALGDQNDDGFNDWAVWAMGARNGTLTDSAYVEFFHGGNPIPEAPYMTIEPLHGFEAGIRGASDVGDINGDGYVDWYVFVGYINNPDQRRVFNFYYGGQPANTTPDFITTTPILSLFYPVGDFNGDGFDDLLLSNSNDEYADIYFGGSPFDTLPDWHRSEYLAGPRDADLNGDGFSDFIDAGPNNNFDIYLGGAMPDTLPAYNWEINHSSVGLVHDQNGDGYAEWLFGITGGAQLYFGNSELDSEPDATLHFPCNTDGPLGFVSAGDVNRDGFNDLLMFTPICNDDATLSLHLGHPWQVVEPALVLHSAVPPYDAVPFETAAGLGDVNGDSVDDFIVGAYDSFEFFTWRGMAIMYAGDSSIHVPVSEGHPGLPEDVSISIYPNPFNSAATFELRLPSGVRSVMVSICNVSGQLVYAQEVDVDQPTVRIHYEGHDLSGSPLSSGLYFLQVIGQQVQQVAKLVILR